MGRASRKSEASAEPRAHWTETHPDRHMWSPGRLAQARTQTREEYEALYGRASEQAAKKVSVNQEAARAARILCGEDKKSLLINWKEDFKEARLDRYIHTDLHYYFASFASVRFPDLQSRSIQKELEELLASSQDREDSLRYIQTKSLQQVLWRIDKLFKNIPSDAGSESLSALRQAEKLLQEIDRELSRGEVSKETAERIRDLGHEIASAGPRTIPDNPTTDDHLYRAAHAALVAAGSLCYDWKRLGANGPMTVDNLARFETHMSLQEPRYRKLTGNFSEPIASSRSLDPYWTIFTEAISKDRPERF